MRRLVLLVLSLTVVAAAWFGIKQAHRVYGSLWLDIYLALFVALPLLSGVRGATAGRQGFKGFFRSLLSVTAGLLIATLVYQNLTENWLWACLAGAVIPGIVTAAREWQVFTAQAKLSQADQALKAKRPKQALGLAQKTRSVYIARGNREGQAVAERYLGIAYAQTGELISAARYLNSALALFRSLGNEEQAKQVEKLLTQLRGMGVDTTASAVSAETFEEEVSRVDWNFVLDGALSIAFVLALLRLWEVESFQASLLAMATFGAVLFLFAYGNYAVFALATAPSREGRGIRGSLLLYNLALLLLALSFTGFLLGQGISQVADFPAALQGVLEGLSSLVADWPSWTLPLAIFVSVLMMLGAIVAASGRSPLDLLRGLWGGDVQRQALQLAMGHLDAKEWTEAITQLTLLIGLLREKDQERRKEVLFCLGFAHYMAEHPKEAERYITDLLESDSQHKEGLYLAGYIALQADQVDEAERRWRELYAIAPEFHPLGSGGDDRGVRYYLCLALYRKAMAVMEKDPEAGAKLLSEVSEIGALDKAASDALIRVHLYRCVSAVRRREWDKAAQEVELARYKLEQLEKLVEDRAEVSKIKGLCQVAGSLVAFRREQYDKAEDGFNTAIEETKGIARKGEFFARPGRSFFEQLLRAAMEAGKGDDDRIAPAFGRDLYFLTSIAQLRNLSEKLARSASPEWKSALSQVKSRLEQSIAIYPDFGEGRAMLGLLYYYLGEDEATKEKGIEILQTIRDRVGSKFVTQTLTQYEADKERREDARKAYFDLLQQYLQFSTVPREERETMRERVLDEMKATGQYEAFIGRGSLELEIEAEREREPTVQEYIDRASLLHEKLEQLKQRDTEDLPPEVQTLMEDLSKHNQELKEKIQEIAKTEQELLLQAQRLL